MPVSAMAKRIPVCSGFFQSREAASAQQQAATGAAGVDGVAYQVGEHLADLSGKTEKGQLRLVFALHANVERADAPLIETENGVKKL